MALLLALCVLLITAADGNSPVKVEEGRDVVLPCSPSTNEDMTSKLFDWKKDGDKKPNGYTEVFMYEDGKTYGNGFACQDKEFEGRVSHFPEELKNGNASIKITKTKVSDSGNYTCDFPRLQPSQKFLIQLVVGACPEPSVTVPKVTKDQALLRCVVRGVSPKPEVEWRDTSGKPLHAEETEVIKKGDRHDIVLQTNVTKDGSYRCVVTQKEICHRISTDVDVDIHGSTTVIILGVFVSLFGLILLLVAGYFCLCKFLKRRQSPNENPPQNAESEGENPVQEERQPLN